MSLPALQLVSPVLPSGSATLSIDADALQLIVQADPSVVLIDVLIGTNVTTLTSFTLVNGLNQFVGSAPVTASDIPQVVQITGQNYLPGVSGSSNALTPTISFELLYQVSSLAIQISAPSGVTIAKNVSTCSVECSLPTYTGFMGVRVQWSTDSSGITTPYQQYGTLLTEVTRSAQIALGPATTTTASAAAPDGSGNTVLTTTSVATVATVNFTSVAIPSSTVNADLFYVILTTLVTDPTTNVTYESQAAGPFTCGFVNLNKVNPTDFLALQKSTDIATRLISEISRRAPNLDLTARADLRDLLISPLSLELANQSIREWFAHESQSISAISQIDDQNGDGVSDPFTSSSYKQMIAQAFGLSATDTQTYINSRFDILGEQAGIPRGGATYATVDLVFYTYTKPTTVLSIPINTIVSTIPNATTTTAVLFNTTASAIIDPTNLNAFYDPVNGWWGVTVPAQAQTAGSIGQVGARTLTQVTSGAQTSLAVTNLLAAENGTDQQSNSSYAAAIQNSLIVGKDDSSRGGYLRNTLQVPGVVAAQVVAAGDNDMLRDWDPIRKKHVYGKVDIYTQGSTQSQQIESVPLTYANTSTYGVLSTYLTLAIFDTVNLRFRINNSTTLTAPLYTAVELRVISAGRTLYLGCANAQFDNTQFIITLDPKEIVYTINSDGSTSQWMINGVAATNLAVIQSLGTASAVTYYLMARYQTGITHIPALQPVISIDSVTGPITGLINPAQTTLYYTTDFLLTGGSNEADDTIVVDPTATLATTKTLTIATSQTTIDSGMSVPQDGNGLPTNVLSVRSSDLSTLYTQGVDYTIVGAGRYHTYALSIPTGSGIIVGSNTQVVVAYNKFILNESITLQTDTLQLNATTAVPLSESGFVYNSWLPVTYGNTTLMLDGFNGEGVTPSPGLIASGVASSMRYIKVVNTSTSAVCLEGSDFQLTVDAATGAATITRVVGGQIPDGGSVTVTYFYNEVFSVASQYPTYVQQAALAIAGPQDAGADVLVKAMVSNAVNVTLMVTLNASTTPDAVDGNIRTAVSMVLDAADQTLSQSSIVSAVRQVAGVVGVQLPLLLCAKADGSYDIGLVIPTGTVWNALSSDSTFSGLTLPSNAYITASDVLDSTTIPSGGLPNAYVGLLYEGQSFRRAMSITDFLNSSTPSFYIIGTNDQLTAGTPIDSSYEGKILLTALDTNNPTVYPYRVTYQTFGQTGAQDLSVSSTEVLSVGTIQILYSS